MPVVRHALLCSILAVSAAAQAGGWRSLQSLPQRSTIDQGAIWWGEQDRLQVSLVDDGVMRVRYAAQSGFGRDHSWAVLPVAQSPTAEIVESEGVTELRSAAIHARIQHAPLRVSFWDAGGQALDADDPERGIAVVGNAVRVWKALQANDQVYGFGQKNGRLNKRGWSQGGYHYTMWNSDTFAYDSSTDPTYVSVPFYLVLREGRAFGVYFDNTHRSSFDIGRESPDLLSFGATGGELDYYVIAGPTPKDVIARYTHLTGRMPMPPRWALGFHQSRWSYHPASKLQWIADTFRQKRIPADTLWLDIDYQQDFKPFTWDRLQFPDPAGLIGGLREQGFRVVTIVDAHPPLQPGYPVYDEGHAGGHFVTRPDGSEFSGPVWPSQAPQDKRDSVFPDFTSASTRDWWGGLYASLLDLGVAGIWNDMNEPSVWIKPSWTMPLDLRHDNEGQPTDHAEAHNVYGMLNTRSTFEGLQRLRPDTRPFVLTRATFAGGQRYAAVWPGDNTADWSALRQSIPTLLGMGLSGFPFVGADIGGFAGSPSPELFTRWLQAAQFSPFMRAHTEQQSADQEPWSYGVRHESINRRVIEARYQWLPQIYNEMEAAHRSGLPAMRPLFLDYPNDPETWSRDDSYLFGSDLLIAPVLVEGATHREVYLPGAAWYSFDSVQRFEGEQSHRVPVELDSLPIFVREGGIVFRQPVVQHTGEMPGKDLIVQLYPGAVGEASFYEDDGETMAFARGVFARRAFRQQRDADGVQLGIDAQQGRWRPAARHWRIEWLGLQGIGEVRDGDRRLAQVDPDAIDECERCWAQAGDRVLIRLPDRATAVNLRLR